MNCPKSFCNSCSEKWESAISSAPEVEMFSSLRRNGFTLQHIDSRLFVCPECLPNTDIAVNSCYRHDGIETVSSRKIPFKISSAIKHKKLLRSSDLSSFQKLEVIFRNKVREKQLNAVDDRNGDTFDLMGSVSIHEFEHPISNPEDILDQKVRHYFTVMSREAESVFIVKSAKKPLESNNNDTIMVGWRKFDTSR